MALIALPQAQDDFLIIGAGVQVSDEVYAWGFPDDYPGGDSVTLEYEGPHPVATPTIEVQGRPGPSGRGRERQWCIKRRAALRGMMRLSRDRRRLLGGRAVPATTLESLVPIFGRHRRAAQFPQLHVEAAQWTTSTD